MVVSGSRLGRSTPLTMMATETGFPWGEWLFRFKYCVRFNDCEFNPAALKTGQCPLHNHVGSRSHRRTIGLVADLLDSFVDAGSSFKDFFVCGGCVLFGHGLLVSFKDTFDNIKSYLHGNFFSIRIPMK